MPGAWLGTDSKTTLANGALALLKQAKAAQAAAVSDSEDDDEYEEEADANAWMVEALGRQLSLVAGAAANTHVETELGDLDGC